MTRSTGLKTDISNTQKCVNFTLDEVKTIIQQSIQEHSDTLLNEIKSLKQEVTDLRQSNIELVRLLANGKCLNHVSNNEYEFVSKNISDINSSIESTSSTNTIIQGQSSFQKRVNTKKRQNINSKQNDTHNNVHVKATQSGRNNLIVGTSSDAAEEFGASISRLWLYVGRCRPNSKPEDIKSYLQRRSPGHNFEVTKLPSLGRNSSYRVEADKELQDILYSPSHWPKGVFVKRFKFRPENKTDIERPF